ncbi:MAG: M50 family metallopeptidase, partial [Euryarchaeota archaeon]|nr:M50 family metallopeptidase [Euryarchaeota archaeon]
LKSVGVGLLIALPLAFTEPEEEAMKKASSWSRIKVYAAGSMANFITGLTALLLITACSSLIVGNGIVVNEVQEGMPAEGILEKGMIVHSVNGIEFNNPSEFSEIMDEFKPGKTIVLGTDKGEKEITLTENPDDPGKGYIGIYLKTYLTTTYGDLFLPIYFSFYWIFALNIGIGLMNLLPIAPVLDGGKIAKEFIDMRFSTNISNAICTVLALFSISLILLNFFPKILTIL